MLDANERLLAIAQTVADTYATNKKVQASAVIGSVARRQADAFSDIDMSIFYDTLPTEDEVAAGREALHAAEWHRLLSGEADAFADSFLIDGVECQVIHV